MCHASLVNYLDISNNDLGGEIPTCIGELGRSLFILNMEANNFRGAIPHAYPRICKLKMIKLSCNQFEGGMPRSLVNCIDLEVLDIAENHVNDTFPSWLGSLPNLNILILRHNNFHGRIGRPKADLGFHSLRIIDLSNNFHTGALPFDYFENWDAMKVINENQSSTSGTVVHYDIVTSGGELLQTEEYDYSITITNKGNDMLYTKILTVLRVIDFSKNDFTGRIPDVIGKLRGLQALNLSNNNLQGEIPSSLAKTRDLESLDLSKNMLSGEIPPQLTQLTSLEVFNVSYNLLVGSIPQGSQFGALDDSSFLGNLGLCGSPLLKKCGSPEQTPPPPASINSSNTEEENSELIDWIIRCLGCLSAFAVGCAFGKYLTDRNHEWFMETFGRRRKGPRTRRRKAARSRI